MGTVFRLAKRNIALYFRDPMSVFFSMLGALIVLVLYVLFLGKMQVDNIAQSMSMVPKEDVNFLVNSWVMGGILSISALTTALGAMGTMVDDRHRGMLKDFRIAPIKRWQLVMGYLLAAALSSFMINVVLFIAIEVLIVIGGGSLLSPIGMAKILGLLALCCVAFTAVSAFLVSLVKTPGAFGGLSSIIGTLLGFLSGAYMPIGVFTGSVQTLVTVLPFSHGAALLRNIFMEEPMRRIFSLAPDNVAQQFKAIYGLTLTLGEHQLSSLTMLATITGFGIVFFVLAVWRMSRSKSL